MDKTIIEIILQVKDRLTPAIEKAAVVGEVEFERITDGVSKTEIAMDRLAIGVKKLNITMIDPAVFKYAAGLEETEKAAAAAAKEAAKLAQETEKVNDEAKKTNKTLFESIEKFGKFALGIGAAAVVLRALKKQLSIVIDASITLGNEQAALTGKTFAYTDATNKLTESHQAWLASIGDFFTKSPAVIETLGIITDLFLDLADANATAQDKMSDLVGIGFVEFVDDALQVVRAVNAITRALNLAAQGFVQIQIEILDLQLKMENFKVLGVHPFGDIAASLGEPAALARVGTTETELRAAEVALELLVNTLITVDEGTDAIIAAQAALKRVAPGGVMPGGTDIDDDDNLRNRTRDNVMESDKLGARQFELARLGREADLIVQESLRNAYLNKLDVVRDATNAIRDEADARKALMIQLEAAKIAAIQAAADARFKPILSQADRDKRIALGLHPGGKGKDPLFDTQQLIATAIQGITSGGVRGGIAALLPAIGSVFGPIGGAIGSLAGSLIGKRKQRGETKNNPVWVREAAKGDLATEFLNIFQGRGSLAGATTINQIVSDISGQGNRLGLSS